MTNEATINKMIEMRLGAMADAYRMQMNDTSIANLSFAERLGLLIDTEYTSRKNNRLKRLIRDAGLDQSYASLWDINYTASRKLKKDQIDQLSTCEYIRDAFNIIIMGASGAGKSYLACAFGMEACKRFYTVRYMRLPELFIELAIAKADGNYAKVLKKYQKCQLLILDDWMLITLTPEESQYLLEIVHARHKRASTVFCSQFAPGGWHNKISETTLADAILDRIVHDSHVIEVHGGEAETSMREVYGINGIKNPSS